MGNKYFTRTVTVKTVTCTSPGKQDLVVDSTDPGAIQLAYCTLNNLTSDAVKVSVVEKQQRRKMSLEVFLAYSEPVDPIVKKGGNK